MIIEHFNPFKGQHCETTATGCLLKHIGIELSESMLFGLGEGFGFIFWNMKMMDFPFIGGRVKPDILTENIVRNLNLKMDTRETSSINKAWENAKSHIDNGIPVGLKLDSYHLEYFKNKIHFAGHYAALYGYDEKYAYLVDTDQQGGKVKTSLKSLELARNEKGSMSSPNRSYTISKKNGNYNLNSAIPIAIKNNALDYLNPPIQNIGYKGILKTSREIKKWFKNSKDVERDFTITAKLMERGGTGGALFRNLYRDFLKESVELLGSEIINKAYLEFCKVAKLWNEISSLFEKAGQTSDVQYINQASDILADLSRREQNTMEMLANL